MILLPRFPLILLIALLLWQAARAQLLAVPKEHEEAERPWKEDTRNDTSPEVSPLNESAAAIPDRSLEIVRTDSPKDSAADVTQPVVKVNSPNGGELWNEDMFHRILWTATYGTAIARIQILYSIDNGKTYLSIRDSVANTGTFLWQIPRTQTANGFVKIVAYGADGRVGSDSSDAAFVIVNVQSYLHKTRHLSTTVRNDSHSGGIGRTADPAQMGFEFPLGSRSNHLALGQLLVAAVKGGTDTIATLDYSDEFFPTDVLRVINRSNYVQTIARYKDKTGFGVEVAERTFAYPDEAFIIHDYRVFNAANTVLPTIYLGMFADFDVGDGRSNRVGINSAEGIIYVSAPISATSTFVGLALLDKKPHAVRRWSGNAGLPATPAEMFRKLAIAGEDVVTTDPAADYRVMQSVEVRSIPVGGSASLAFVVAIGSSLTELIATVRTAKTKWLEVSGLIAEIEPNNNGAQAQLVAYGDSLAAEIRPAGDQDFFRYSVMIGDTVDIITQNVGDTELDGHLTVFNAAGVPITANDDFLSVRDSRVTYLAKSGGTNFVRFADNGSIATTTESITQRSRANPRTFDLFSFADAESGQSAQSPANTGQYRLSLKRFRKGAPVGVPYGEFNLFATTASLDGKFYPNGLSTTIIINYGTTPGYGNSVTIAGSPFNEIAEVEFSSDLTGLTPNTEYHYEMVGTNSLGNYRTPNQTFRTPEASKEWTRRSSGTMELLWSLAFGAQKIGTAVGTSGIILRTTDGGATWNSQKSGVEQSLLGVSFSDANSGVAVGLDGTLLRTSNGGSTWENRSTSSALMFVDVHMVDASVAYAVGNSGVIVRTSNGGLTWQTQTSNTTNNLRGIHFTRTNTGVAVGQNGTILRTTNGGTTWTQITSPVAQSFYKVHFPDVDTGYVVSHEGGILKTVNGGQSWIPQVSGVTSWLADLFFTDGRTGVVVGEAGLVLRTTNGGAVWFKEASGTGNYLFSVAANRDGGLVTVGDFGTILTGSVAAGPAAPTNPTVSPTDWSKTNSFVLSWTNPPNVVIQKVWIKFGQPPSVSSPATASFSITSSTVTFAVPDVGSHQVYFYLEDKDGNRNPNNHAMVIAQFDSVKPTVTHSPGSVAKVVFSNGALVGSPPAISATSAKTAGLSAIENTKLLYKRSNDNTFTELDFPTPTGGSVSIPATVFVVSGAARGAEYRIRATDEAGNSSLTPIYSILVEVQSQTTATSLPPAAGEGSDRDALVKSYRLFSVPLELANKKPSEFMESTDRGFGSHKKDNVNYYFWRMSRLIGGSFQHYEDFKNSDVLTVGSAFFLIRRDGNSTIKVGAGNLVKLKDMVDTGIPLQAGWNLVGNPLSFAFSSDSLTVTNGSIVGRAYYDGTGPQSGWHTSGTQIRTLFPWQGLAINVTQATTLKFKALPSEQSQSASIADQLSGATIRSEADRSAGAWTVSFSATRLDNGMRDLDNSMGMLRGASEDFDIYDSYQPPFVGERNVALYYMNDNRALTNDLRPVNPQGGNWEMKLESGDKGSRVRLSWDASQLPRDPSFKAFLIDLDEKMAYDLRLSSSAEITTKIGLRNFRVVVGDAEYVNSHSAGVDLVPQVAKLFANYPNPFNAETIIRYAIPGEMQTYQVALRIYNVIGQEVVTLVEQEQGPGYYEVRFHANDLASGIYLYRLTVFGGTKESTFADSRKMMLLR